MDSGTFFLGSGYLLLTINIYTNTLNGNKKLQFSEFLYFHLVVTWISAAADSAEGFLILLDLLTVFENLGSQALRGRQIQGTRTNFLSAKIIMASRVMYRILKVC